LEHPIIIVGGGLGGLAAAIELAARGRRVLLLEKNERVGGKLNIVSEAGYTFDTGPSLLTMPWVLRALFESAGARLEDELDLVPVEPNCRYNWPDGTRFDAFQSLPLLLQAIGRLDRRDVGGFLRFMAYAERIYQAVAGPFLLHPFDGLRDLLTPALLRDTWKIDPLRTVDQAVRSFFHSPYLRQVFNRYATYNGSSPYRAPATFNLIAYIEFAEGGWYVRGGMYTLARAQERLARRLGVEIRTRSPVERVQVRAGAARGVALAGGECLDAQAVIVNADPRYAYQELLPEQRRTAARLARLEPSCSGFILLLGIDRTYPILAHHNIFFSDDYQREFAAIFDKRVPAPDPTVYVCTTSLCDPGHAPPGHSNLFVLINAPALSLRVNWEREASGYRDAVIRKLTRMGLHGLEQHITYERIIAPDDLQTRYNAPDGAIYGLASNQPWTAFLRPPLRAPDLRRLYFVGGGTHPGGGIPLVLLSGQAVAERVVADQGSA
jgi:phytoene desaturase